MLLVPADDEVGHADTAAAGGLATAPTRNSNSSNVSHSKKNI